MKADLLRSDLTEGKVWFVNYAALDVNAVAADQLDLHGAGMLPEDVEKFAHRWLAYAKGSIDIDHDGVGRPIYAIESFFNGPSIASQAWPINTHAVHLDASASKEAMEGLRTGRLNSVSLDAFTFNKVVRLPAAGAQLAAAAKTAVLDHSSVALAVAQMGFPGVRAVSALASGLYVVEREIGTPLAVSIKDGIIEATASGGAWAEVAATLCTAGSMISTSRKLIGPEVGYTGEMSGHFTQPVDYAPWDTRAVLDMLAGAGIEFVDGVENVFTWRAPAADALETASMMEDAAFAYVDEASQRAYVPHHTEKGVNYTAVVRGLMNVGHLPVDAQASVRAHLLEHHREITRTMAGGA